MEVKSNKNIGDNMKHFLIVEIGRNNKSYYAISGNTLKSAFTKVLRENTEYFGWTPEEYFDNIKLKDGKWQLSIKRIREYSNYILDSMLNINDDRYLILNITNPPNIIEIKEM